MTQGHLHRHLRLPDLVLAQILIVVGTNWFGAAATLGMLGVLFWPLALLLYHGPLAVVVMALVRACPEEAGPYQWVKRAYGPRMGLFFGWILCSFMLVFLAAGCLGLAGGLSYALKSVDVDLQQWPVVGTALPFVFLALLTAFGWSGFRQARWVQNLAAVALLLVLGLLGYRILQAGLLDTWPGFGMSVPTDSRTWISLLKILVFALSGLEFLALVAGECERPERTLPRAIQIAAPINIAIYMIGTFAVVLTIPLAAIDQVNPVAQVLGSLGGVVATGVLWALLLRDFGQNTLGLSGVSRLPMQVGLDGRLPAWFGRVNARGVPTHAVLICALIIAAILSVVTAGSDRQEAFQMLLSAAGIQFGLTYVLMFSLPVFASAAFGLAQSALLRVCALLGGSLATVFVLISVYPIDSDPDPLRHAWRVLLIVLVLLLPGALLAFLPQRR
ncbi:APC family permease [Ahniella affigens]|nr:APC family permease [Ahniella affigens]